MRQTVRVALLISKQSILRRVEDLPSVISVLTKECAFLSSKTCKRRGKARSDVGGLVVLAAANLRLSGTPPRKRCHTPRWNTAPRPSSYSPSPTSEIAAHKQDFTQVCDHTLIYYILPTPSFPTLWFSWLFFEATA